MPTDRKKDFYLKNILDNGLSKNILLDTFNKVFASLSVGLISLSEMKDNNLLACLDNCNLRQNQKESMYYWVHMVIKYGTAQTWEYLKRRYSKASASRKKKQILAIIKKLDKTNNNLPDLIQFLRNEHEKFELIKPAGDNSVCKPL